MTNPVFFVSKINTPLAIVFLNTFLKSASQKSNFKTKNSYRRSLQFAFFGGREKPWIIKSVNYKVYWNQHKIGYFWWFSALKKRELRGFTVNYEDLKPSKKLWITNPWITNPWITRTPLLNSLETKKVYQVLALISYFDAFWCMYALMHKL